MFFDEIQNLHPLLFIISIFAAVFIVIAIYVKHANNKLSNKYIQNSEKEVSQDYVSIDHRRLSEMLMNK